jgi:hypothetical protein
MMLLGEISELSLELAIEGRFDVSIFVAPSGVAKKYVDAFLERQTLNKNRGGALCTGADGPRPGARRDGALCTGVDGPRAGPDGPRPGARLGLLPDGRTVRACAGAAEDRRRRLDLAPGRDPVREERS